MQHPRSFTLIGGLAAVLAASAMTAGAASAANDIQPPPAGTGLGAAKVQKKAGALPRGVDAATQRRQEALLPIAQRISKEANDADSTVAGVEVDAESNTVTVYSTDGEAPRSRSALPDGAKLKVKEAKFSRVTMIQAADRVLGDAKALGEQQRIGVQAVGPAVDGSGITVTVVGSEADAATATDALQERYGDVVAKVVAVERKTSDSDLFHAGFRFNDYAPWYGGDRLASSVGGCTSGFAAVQGGLPAVLTAAHCGGVGTAFSNGPGTTGGFRAVGSSVYSNADNDVAAIRTTSMSNYINVGPALTPSQKYIGSWGSPVVGQYLCQSGSYTGEVCNLRVVDTYQSVCRSWILWWCSAYTGPLSDVINASGSGVPAAGHGDSGAPVYLPSGSGGIAVGLVHGVLTPNAAAAYPAYGGDTMWCNSPEGWQQRCASGFSFAHMPGY